MYFCRSSHALMSPQVSHAAAVLTGLQKLRKMTHFDAFGAHNLVSLAQMVWTCKIIFMQSNKPIPLYICLTDVNLLYTLFCLPWNQKNNIQSINLWHFICCKNKQYIWATKFFIELRGKEFEDIYISRLDLSPLPCGVVIFDANHSCFSIFERVTRLQTCFSSHNGCFPAEIHLRADEEDDDVYG